MTWPTVAKQVFAHYFTPYPLSFNNETARPDQYDNVYIAPGGTTYQLNGATVNSSTSGGMFRDRPPFRHSTATSFTDDNFQFEVRTAIAGGLDGWTMDLLSLDRTSGHWARQEGVMAAAAAVSSSFKVMLMPDMGSWNSMTASAFASRIKTLAAYSSVYTISGKLVISPFHAENWTVTQWNAAISATETATGMTVAFVPCFLSQATGTIDTYLGVTRIYGASCWGNRSPAGQTNIAALAAYAHSKGLVYMTPVSVQDERPDQRIYDEAVNSHNLEDSWAAAGGFSGGYAGSIVTNGIADWVQIPTWNDYSEGAQLAPSVQHGSAYLNLSQYYANLWKNGLTPSTAPTPTTDSLFLTHRIHNNNATITGQTTAPMVRRGGTSTASDKVEVLSILTASGTVSLNVGGSVTSTTAPIGLSRFTANLGPGVISSTLTRGGAAPLTVQTPFPANASVSSTVIQDEGYHAATASRVPTPTPSSVLFGVTDAALPASFFDTMEGAYSGGAGSGCGNRIPVVHVADTWTTGMAAFGAATRELALFNAGHNMVVSFPPPPGAAPYTDITSGTYDGVLNTLSSHINALSFGAAVSGAQAGQAYGGLTARSVRICFDPQMDTNTTHGTVAQQQAAYRYVMNKITAGLATRTRVICVWAPSGGAASNGKATVCLPGLTATDFVDEIGVQFPVSATTYTNFPADIVPWKTWLSSNAPTRKFFPIKMAVHVDPNDAAHQGTYMAGVETEIAGNPTLYSGAIWDALPTGALDDRSPAKTNNATLFTAFVNAVSAAIATGGPPVDVTPPGLPTNLSNPSVTATTAVLTWTPPTDADFAGVQVFKNGTLLATVNAGTNTYTATALTTGTAYQFALTSFDTATPANVSIQTPALAATPTASGPPQISAASVAMNQNVATASATATDPASGSLAFTWQWGDGNVDPGSTATHTYAAPGTYIVILNVTSSASNLISAQTFTVVALLTSKDVTPFAGFILPIKGVPARLYTDSMRGNWVGADQLLQALSTETSQTGDGATFVNAPVTSYRGAVDVVFEPASSTYPSGRVLVTGEPANALAVGQSTIQNGRDEATSNAVTLATQQMRFTYFTAKFTSAITQLRLLSGATAAGATPTLVRAGIYSVDPSTGALALIASFASDTSLFAAASTAYTKSFTASFNMVSGTRYALGQLVVTGATVPTVAGKLTIAGGVLTEAALAPRMAAVLSAQSDLPSSVADASLTSTTSAQYAVLLP